MSRSLFARFKDAVTAWVGKPMFSRWGGTGVGSRYRFLLPGATFDYEKDAGDPWANSTASICLRWLGDNFQKPTMRVCRIERSGKTTPDANHKMLGLLRKPNPFYTGRTLWKALALSLKVDGNGYLLVIRDGLKRPVQLWWLPHWLVMPCWPPDGSTYISHYQIRIDAETKNVPISDIIHFRDGIDPRNDRLGLSALKSQMREVCTDNETSGFTAALLRNSGVPSLAIIPGEGEDEIDRKAAEKIKERFKDTMTGDDRGEPVVFARGAKIVEIGFSPEKLRLDRLPRLAMSKICAAIGVNPMTIGLPDEARTYNNQADARRGAWENGLVPLQDLCAETVRYQLLPNWEDPERYTVDFDYSQVESLQESQDLKSARIVAQWEKQVITKNEARDILGYEPDPDGDLFFGATAPMEGQEGDLGPTTMTTGDVQATALNGAQVTSLVEIANAVATGTLPPETGRALVAASFPGLTEEQIGAIVDPLVNFEPPAPEPPPMPPGTYPKPEDDDPMEAANAA